MMLEWIAHAALAELRATAAPVVVGSSVVSRGQEDHVSSASEELPSSLHDRELSSDLHLAGELLRRGALGSAALGVWPRGRQAAVRPDGATDGPPGHEGPSRTRGTEDGAHAAPSAAVASGAGYGPRPADRA